MVEESVWVDKRYVRPRLSPRELWLLYRLVHHQPWRNKIDVLLLDFLCLSLEFRTFFLGLFDDVSYHKNSHFSMMRYPRC
jgi:hypothetical protein